ncbi:hypothetical protein [Mameliella sediminis]|uniref:hypothetical protein n=1 Tax=Mameliella sediminis TaxID=2836866 RepID=UPI001C436F29|nr:hypothetical protein [Mameliella sediminis]MBV7392979.1 hypothetical protein [Mameliella sediminis]
MKLCLIGDSHAAMLIAAHRQDPRGETLTVFAKPGLAASEVAMDGQVLRASTDAFRDRLRPLGTADSLDLGTFDAVILAGLVPSAFAAVRLQQDHHVSGWPSGAKALSRALSGDTLPKARPLLTRAAYRAALSALTGASLAALIARAAPGPVWVVPQPYPSDALLQDDGKYPVFRRVVRNGDGDALSQDLNAAHKGCFGTIGNARLVTQPSTTLAQGCLTQAEFMRGGPRLAEGGQQQADDVLHGNAKLGALLLAAIRHDMG